MNQLTEEQRKQPERIWRTTNGYIYKGRPTPEPCVEYVRADLLTTARKEARAEGRLEGLREADGLSCMAGAIRERIKLLEAAATTQKGIDDAERR